MYPSTKEHVINLLNHPENVYSIWMVQERSKNTFFVISAGPNSFNQELSFLLKEPSLENPVCLFRDNKQTIKGQEWLDPIAFHKREKR